VIDLRLLRSTPVEVRAALARRGDPALKTLLDDILGLDERRRAMTTELDSWKAERNESARADAQTVKQQGTLPPEVVAQRRALGARIADAEQSLRQLEAALEAKALYAPNLPLPDVPDGDQSANRVVRSWGTPLAQGPDLKPHWELGERLGILDLARGAKLAGSGFPVLIGWGARLARALIQFMLARHTREHGYIEVEPPFLVRREIMQGTGQLPKFEEDAYRTAEGDLFLVPTAEVPVTNLYRDEILDGARLPIAFTAYTPCFRREAGAAGKDTRGLLRVHQFDKVELVRFVKPADSAAEHERLTQHAETVLQRLGLPYRVVLLAAGDTGFAAAKTYDLEAWAPGVGAWLEVSSSSSFTDFQARRANIRFRSARGEKPEFVHTLNASGLALPRTIAALLESGQRPDGSVALPPALAAYAGTDSITLPPSDG